MRKNLLLMRHIIFRYLIILLACISPVISYQQPAKWLEEINIAGEGESVTDVGNAIISQRIYSQNSVYHASIGVGDVVGVSIKQHLVPFVESGYQSQIMNRLFIYDQHNFLVLICNDALYTDWLSTTNLDAAVVVTHLADFKNTPLLSYFDKKLRYISLLKSFPIRHVDQDFSEYYSLA